MTGSQWSRFMTDLFLPDLNVLFAAVAGEHVHHVVARTWIEQANHFATCPLTESGLLRLLTNDVIRPGARYCEAVQVVNELRALPVHDFWSDDTTLVKPVIDTSVIMGYRQIPDFHLLNLAASRGARLVTLDGKIAAAVRPRDRKYIELLR